MKKYICVILISIAFLFPLYTNALTKTQSVFDEAGVLLWSTNVEKQARGELLMAAMTGTSLKARFVLGWWYLKIKSATVDSRKKGVSLIYSAYLEGDRDAGYFMAVIYKKDVDIYGLKNEKKATDLLRSILINDSSHPADHEETLGKWLLEESIEKNKEEAESWLIKSIEHGNIAASSTLAPLFTQGEDKDLVKAWFYSDLSGTSMVKEKRELEQQMTPEQVEQAQNMSWDWQDAHHIHVPGYRGHGSPIRWQVE